MLGFPWRNPATEISRVRHIAEVLIRNGLGFLAENIGLTRLLPPWRARRVVADAQMAALSLPQRLRRTLEQLGPTYIKLGQILSTRPDILPAAYIVELSKLLDAAPPVPFEEIAAAISRELGGPWERWYATLSPTPIASASIGQVHRATLRDGTAVVVKVQRPGVERTIQADLILLLTQARFVEGRSETLKQYRLVDILEEFAEALRDELDYMVEGRNAERLRDVVADEHVVIPKVYWSLTTRRVITLTDLNGIKLTEVDRLKAQGYDLASVAASVVQVYLDQVFVHGIFHADPHPANILVCDHRVGLVDFGVVGYLTPTVKEQLAELLFALVQRNAEDMVEVIARMGAMAHNYDRDGLRRDMQRLLVRYYGASLESVPIAQFLGDIMVLAFKHRARLPADLALLVRTVVVLEGVALGLDPTIVLATHLEPFVVQLIKERVSLRRAFLRTVNTLSDFEALAHVLPQRVDVLSEQLERGEMTVGIDVRHLSLAMRKLDAVGNRLSFSIIVAGIIVGSALVLAGGEKAATFSIPFTSIALPIPQIGFIIAGLLGLWLLFSIVRSRGL